MKEINMSKHKDNCSCFICKAKRNKLPRELRICTCGSMFECKVTSHQKYCKASCSEGLKRVNELKKVNHIVRICSCGNNFKVRTTSTQKYCCRSCSAHYTKLGRHPSEDTKRKIGKKNSAVLKGRIYPDAKGRIMEIRTCTCGKQFEVSILSKQKYCCSGHASLNKPKSIKTKDLLRRKGRLYWSTVDSNIANTRISKAMRASSMATGQRPNKFERVCMSKLNQLYGDKFIYTGNGTKIVNHKSADAYSEELNTVALFHGCYFHLEKAGLELTEENKRAVEKVDSIPFLLAGYKVIVIWEDELDKVIVYE